jgi:hypothetical protein
MKTISASKSTFCRGKNPSREAIHFKSDLRNLLNYLISGYPDVEKFKLERKRERNRIAATKCR